METIAEKLQREGIELASIQKRALAFLIDDILLNGLLFIIYLPSLMPLFNDPQAQIKAPRTKQSHTSSQKSIQKTRR